MRVVHLCFHGIGMPQREREPGEAAYWIGVDLFHRTLDEVVGRADVRLSFDDGNRSDIEIALPALRERRLDARFFPLAGRLNDPLSVSPSEIRELAAAGMRIGSHGWDHQSMRRMSDAVAERELHDARVALEEVAQRRVSELALPLGQYDRGLLRRARSAGYASVFTSDRRPTRDSAWVQPRYSIGAADSITSVRRILTARRGVGTARSSIAGIAKRLR